MGKDQRKNNLRKIHEENNNRKKTPRDINIKKKRSMMRKRIGSKTVGEAKFEQNQINEIEMEG